MEYTSEDTYLEMEIKENKVKIFIIRFFSFIVLTVLIIWYFGVFENDKHSITLQNYNKITNGMDYSTVCSLLDMEAELIEEVTVINKLTGSLHYKTTYIYKPINSYKKIMIVFIDGHVYQKKQTYIKY